MRFVKAQTNGNDFVIITRQADEPAITNEIVKMIANRHFGIGCDQVAELTKITDVRYGISFFNTDGSHAEMCGNGICASSLYVSKMILSTDSVRLSFTVSGREHRTVVEDEKVTLFTAKPILLHNTPEYQILSMGNKHLVCDIKMIDSVMDLKNKFHECNLHFIEFVDNLIRVKTFERGAGWTKACGSGAIAVTAAQNISDPVRVKHDGGISIVSDQGDIFSLTVRPKLVFCGNFYDD
jgi:diaminopimelate epimerase